ncbi:PhzF family phenazine biosynthesis protein [Streptomyces sp. SAS_275]|uniref:PhzF family phenazine biosynthesis protein n=1 Tax=Streptomyces sp. SAS_275 TaxID=3412746 RepID=UPI00403CB211
MQDRVPGLEFLVTAGGAAPAEAPFDMRTFAPGANVPEDPACGSMNAAVGQWRTFTGAAPPAHRVRQGTRLARAATIEVTDDPDGTVWISGATTVTVRGTITL